MLTEEVMFLLQELQHAAAVRLQAKVRAWIGHKRCTAWGEVKRQRVRDIDISSRKMQVSELVGLFVGSNHRSIRDVLWSLLGGLFVTLSPVPKNCTFLSKTERSTVSYFSFRRVHC